MAQHDDVEQMDRKRETIHWGTLAAYVIGTTTLVLSGTIFTLGPNWIRMGLLAAGVLAAVGEALGVAGLLEAKKKDGDRRALGMAVAGVMMCGIALLLIIVGAILYGQYGPA